MYTLVAILLSTQIHTFEFKGLSKLQCENGAKHIKVQFKTYHPTTACRKD